MKKDKKKNYTEFEKKVLQTVSNVDILINGINESIDEFYIKERSEKEYTLLISQINYVMKELKPVMEKISTIVDHADQKFEVITSEIQQ